MLVEQLLANSWVLILTSELKRNTMVIDKRQGSVIYIYIYRKGAGCLAHCVHTTLLIALSFQKRHFILYQFCNNNVASIIFPCEELILELLNFLLLEWYILEWVKGFVKCWILIYEARVLPKSRCNCTLLLWVLQYKYLKNYYINNYIWKIVCTSTLYVNVADFKVIWTLRPN